MTRIESEEPTSTMSTTGETQNVTVSRTGWLLRPITALVRALSLLNPAVVLALLSRAIDHVAAVVHPRAERRRKLMAWLRESLPESRARDIQSLSSVWQDGSLLCTLVQSVVPGCSPNRSVVLCTSFQHGQLLICKYLGVPPAFSEDDTRQQTLTPALERRLVRYLLAVRQAAVPLLSANTSTPQKTRPPVPLALARGMGLLMAVQGRRAVFYLYPLDRESSDHFAVEIHGPSNDFGSAYIPAPATATRGRQQRRAAFILKPWFSTTRIANIPIDWKVNPGSICVSYVPQSAGKHELCVTRRSCHLPGSPYTVTVDRSSSRPDSRDDKLWISEEEIEKRREYKKRLKVVLRIVDFVTEKMVLTDDGKFTKLVGPNHIGIRTLSMPNLFSRLQETSESEILKEKLQTHDDIKLRDKSVSQEFVPETDDPLKVIEPPFKPVEHHSEAKINEHNTSKDCKNLISSPYRSADYRNHPIINSPLKVKGKVEVEHFKKARDSSSWPRYTKPDKDIFGRKIKNVVSLCNHLVRNTPRQQSLEILNAAGCILDGRPIRLSKDMDVLLMSALGRKIQATRKETELVRSGTESSDPTDIGMLSEGISSIQEGFLSKDNISSNTDINKNTSNKSVKKNDRKVSFLIPDDKSKCESSGDKSQDELSCGHEKEKLPTYISDAGHTTANQKCMKCVRTELSGLNIISQLSDETSQMKMCKMEPKTVSIFAPKGYQTQKSVAEHMEHASDEPPPGGEVKSQQQTISQADEKEFDTITNENLDECSNLEANTKRTDSQNDKYPPSVKEKPLSTVSNVTHSSNEEELEKSTYILDRSEKESQESTTYESQCKDESKLGVNKSKDQGMNSNSELYNTSDKIFGGKFELTEKGMYENLSNTSDKNVNRSGTCSITDNNISQLGEDISDECPTSTCLPTTAVDPEGSSECTQAQLPDFEKLLPHNSTESFDDINQNFSLWSSDIVFGSPPDQAKEYQSVVDFDSILSASNLEEALKIFEEDIQRAQGESRSTNNTEEREEEIALQQEGAMNESPINAQQEGERDSDYISMEDNRSSQEHTPENQQNQENHLVDVNEWMQDTNQMGPAEREIWGVRDDDDWSGSEPNRFYPRVLTPGIPNLECITEETEDAPNCVGSLKCVALKLENSVTPNTDGIYKIEATKANLEERDEIAEENGSEGTGETVLERAKNEQQPGGYFLYREMELISKSNDTIALVNSIEHVNCIPGEPISRNSDSEPVRVGQLLPFAGDPPSCSQVNVSRTEMEVAGERNNFGQTECSTEGDTLKYISDFRNNPGDEHNLHTSLEKDSHTGKEYINEYFEEESNVADRAPSDEVQTSYTQTEYNCNEGLSESCSEISNTTYNANIDVKHKQVISPDLNNTTSNIAQDNRNSQSNTSSLLNVKVPIIIVEDTELLDSDDDMDPDSVDDDISNPEEIEEEFNTLAGLIDGESYHENMNIENSIHFKTSYEEDHSYDNTDLIMIDTCNESKIISDINEENDDDRIRSDNKIHDTPVKMRVTHWKQYWDGKTADQKRKEEGKSSGPQKTIKKFASQYLKSCNTSNWQPRKRRAPSIRIPGIVNKWRKTFEDSISVNNDSNEQTLLRSNRIAKQWHKFFEYDSRAITPTQCSSDAQQEAVNSKEVLQEMGTTKSSTDTRSNLTISSNEDPIQVESVPPHHKQEMAEMVPKVEKSGFTLRLFSPLPVITNNHVTQRKMSFEKEALEATRPTVTSKVLPFHTSNHVAKCKEFWDSISKEEHTIKPLPKIITSPQIRTNPNLSAVVHTPCQLTSGVAQAQSSVPSVFGSGGSHGDVKDGLYRARLVAVCSDIELSSGVSTPVGQETTCHNTILPAVSEQHDEDSDKVQPPHRTNEIKKPETPDTRARFQSAKLFFQILERSTSTAPKPPVGPFSYASSTDFDETESECGDEGQRRQRRKRRQKIFSEPTSDTETLSRLSGLRRRGVGALVGGSDRLPRRKVSERFHVKDLFRDVAGGGIPHREAVLAALRSVDNSRPVSPYDEQEELEPPVSPGPQVYHTEYPHLPATPPCHFRPRDMLQHGAFMTRRDLINMQ